MEIYIYIRISWIWHIKSELKSLLSNAFWGFVVETANPRGALDYEALHAMLCMC